MKIQEIRALLRERLEKAGIESADAEVWLMMEAVPGITRADYYMEPDREIDKEEVQKLCLMADRRAEHFPLQYLTGETEFMGYSFLVNRKVLIPRQDTECLVEEAVREIGEIQSRRPGQQIRVLDLCTGSGCIGISVSLLCPETEVILSDLSREALSVARENIRRLHSPAKIIESDLFENIGGKFDVILSNPPYIPTGDIEELMPEVRDYEPVMALDGDLDGLKFYREITGSGRDYLNPDGRLIMEIGAWQGKDVSAMLEKAGYKDVRVLSDLAGLDRVVRATY